MRRFTVAADDAAKGRKASTEATARGQARYRELTASAQSKARAGIPLTQQPNYVRCYDGTASLRQRIRAFCLECCGYDREAVTSCAARGCPLWAARPYQAG
jgi:hypothetical protein